MGTAASFMAVTPSEYSRSFDSRRVAEKPLLKCPTPRTSHVRMSHITRRGFQVISLCESTGWEAIVRGARSFLRAGGQCRLFVTSALVMLLSAAVNLLLNHIIATRDVAIKDQSAADTAAAVAAAAAAAAAAAEEDAMAEAAAEARKAGLETSMDAPESRSINSLPPQAAHAPGPLDTFGLTVSDNRVEFQLDVPFHAIAPGVCCSVRHGGGVLAAVRPFTPSPASHLLREVRDRCSRGASTISRILTPRTIARIFPTQLQHSVRVRRSRLGDHVDTLSAAFMLARAFMFTGYLAEAEEHASVCQGMAAALLHPSARARVRAEAMQAQLLEERGQLQEAEKRQVNCVLIFREVSINVRADCSYEQLLDDQLAYFGEIPLLLMLTGDVIATHQHCSARCRAIRRRLSAHVLQIYAGSKKNGVEIRALLCCKCLVFRVMWGFPGPIQAFLISAAFGRWPPRRCRSRTPPSPC